MRSVLNRLVRSKTTPPDSEDLAVDQHLGSPRAEHWDETIDHPILLVVAVAHEDIARRHEAPRRLGELSPAILRDR